MQPRTYLNMVYTDRSVSQVQNSDRSVTFMDIALHIETIPKQPNVYDVLLVLHYALIIMNCLFST